MPQTENRDLRPPKKVYPSKTGFFGPLLSRAIREPDLACDFAIIYDSLGRKARKKIVEIVTRDAHSEGIDISAVLVALLAVERDAQIARFIAANISVDGGEKLVPSRRANALLAGDEQSGGVVIVRPLYASFIDAYAIAWNSEEGITHALCEPITSAVDATHYTECLPKNLAFNEASVVFAINRVAGVLWNQIKRFGLLPAEMNGFAALFGD